jgi:NADH-quinone oxidoreductase subunit H
MFIKFLWFLALWLVVIVPILIAVAYFTLVERKILGSIQRRRGPNVVGFFGALQPLSDGFKLLVKEILLPSSSNKLLFIVAPFITFVLSLMNWVLIPITASSSVTQIPLSILFIFAVSSLGVYGILISGWASNSKYAFLGSLRSAAQMLSYEVSLGFLIIIFFLFTGSLDLISVVTIQENFWFGALSPPLFAIFFTTALAETNRHPFDLPEAEAELVSGYNVEYSAMNFALFSLGEYSNMLVMSALNVLLFFGGWLSPKFLTNFIHEYFNFLYSFWLEILVNSLFFSLKLSFFVILYIFMRAALPRYRYDQLMDLGWKVFLPIALVFLLFAVMVLSAFNILPA